MVCKKATQAAARETRRPGGLGRRGSVSMYDDNTRTDSDGG